MHPTLATLRTALPSAEFAALTAWVGTFYKFQRGWLLDPSRFALCNKSRQIGFSHTTAGWAVIRAGFLGETTTIISKGERESLEVLEHAAKHASALRELGATWCEAKPKGEALNFANGGRIIALPASSGGRSFSGNVVLDEFAYHEGRADRVWDAASAVAMHGYCIRVISTPNGVGNLFHTLATDPKAHKGWSLHRTSVHDAIRDGMRVDLDDCWAMAHGDPRVFAQLFECSFLDGAEQYIPTEAITRAVVEPMPEHIDGVSYGGLDVGLTNDLASLTIVTQDNRGEVWERATLTWKRTAWDEQQEGIERAFRDWNLKRLCVDSTGLGLVPAQLLQKKLGRSRVEPVNFTSAVKEELATTLYQAFSDSVLHIRRDQDVIDDLCALKRIVTSSGGVRYDAERTDRGHADRAWSLALALMACSKKPGTRTDFSDGEYSYG